MTKRILVTGAAGFIGFNTVKYLLNLGYEVWGFDNINDYYDVNLKYSRLTETGIPRNEIRYGISIYSRKYPKYCFTQGNLEDADLLNDLFKENEFNGIIHLAAQAGVRYSLTNPKAYLTSNLEGFLNILEARRHFATGHLVYASSSSVYGLNTTYPLSVHDNVDHPISLYAASKKSNELMAHCYSYLYKIPTTGLRFFTVYGPWGRPDMALFLFTKNMLANKPIDVYNNGEMIRDFTYIDDIVEGIVRVFDNEPKGDTQWDSNNPDPATSPAPYRIFNIGNSNPIKLTAYIDAIENALNIKSIRNLMPMQLGDVKATHADVKALEDAVGYKPSTPIEQGVANFIEWYKKYYNV